MERLLTPHIWIPLCTALAYTVAALLLKRALQQGAGTWRIAFVSNMSMALLVLPVIAAGKASFSAVGLMHAGVAALTFTAGQILTFLALGSGDASVATPVMGSKVIFVALFTMIVIGEPVRPIWWAAAGLTAVATAFLGGKVKPGMARQGRAILYGFLSATSFAMTDVLIQKWSPEWGFTRFVPTMFMGVGILSLAFLPLCRSGSMQPGTWKWLIAGSALLGLQGLGMAFVLSEFGHATVVNIVYSSRGVWTVLLVWGLGKWFANVEREQGTPVMAARLLGAGLIVCAIWMTLQ